MTSSLYGSPILTEVWAPYLNHLPARPSLHQYPAETATKVLLSSNYSASLPLQYLHALQAALCLVQDYAGLEERSQGSLAPGSSPALSQLLNTVSLLFPHFSGVLDHSGCYRLQQLPWTTRANPLFSLGLLLLAIFQWFPSGNTVTLETPFASIKGLLWTACPPRNSRRTSNVIELHTKWQVMNLTLLG